MIKFWAISKNTFVQTIRQPIYGILIVVTFMVLLLALCLAGWTMGVDYHTTDQKMLENLGLSTLLVSGLLTAAFSASSVLSREIEDKTALTVIAKPVARATFVVSKFAGVAAAVTVAFYLCGLVFLMTVRHRVTPATADPYDWPVIVLGLTGLALAIMTALAGNYFFGWPFVSVGVWAAVVLLSLAMGTLSFIGKEWRVVPFGHDTPETLAIHGQLLVGMALIYMAVTIFVAIAVAASTRLGQVMTLLVCCGVFFLGSMHPYLFGYWQDEIMAARVMAWVVPNLTYFFPLDALANDQAIPAERVALAGGYCALYIAAVLAVGMALFERRQLESQGTSSTMPGAVALLAWTGRGVTMASVIVAMVLASLPAFRNVTGLLLIGGILTAAGLNWLLWRGFGAGLRWALWVASGLAGLLLLGLIAATVMPGRFRIDPSGPTRVITIAGAILAGAVALILSLPKTRRHFR